MEEARIFPAVAHVYPTPSVLRCIAELEEDHAALLERVCQINILLDSKPVSQGPNPILNRQLLDFFAALGRHALREDKLFADVNRLIYSVGVPLDV